MRGKAHKEMCRWARFGGGLKVLCFSHRSPSGVLRRSVLYYAGELPCFVNEARDFEEAKFAFIAFYCNFASLAQLAILSIATGAQWETQLGEQT